MRNMRFLVVLFGLLLMAGCTGVGIVATSDPDTKLNDAEYLFMNEGRPLPAEKLIRQAITIYQERDDSHGLGNAYREYGDLLRSPAVSKWEKVYRRDGFQDQTVTFDNRFDKASEKYSKSLEYYERAEQKYRGSGDYDRLAHVYVNMAYSNYRLNNIVKACSFYEKTLAADDEAIKVSSISDSTKGAERKGCSSLRNMVESFKKQIGCT